MSAIDQLVSVQISLNESTVAQTSFAIPMILGKTAAWTDSVIHVYTEPADMLTDGFTSTSPEYLVAVAMFSQTVTPSQFMVGKRTSEGTFTEDLTAISAEDDNWYACILAGLPDTDIATGAAYFEGTKKIMVTSSATAAIATSATDDLASTLKAANYNRTALFFTTANAQGLIEGGLLGWQLPQTVGSTTYAFKTLSGVTGDTLTSTQQAILIGNPIADVEGKNVNIYQNVGGRNITEMGTMASGRFIDIQITLDWLQSNIQSSIYGLLQTSGKVPYTDQGVSMLMQVVRSVLDQGVLNGAINGKSAAYPITVTAPNVDTVSAAKRSARISPPISFSCLLQGAIHAVPVQGVVNI